LDRHQKIRTYKHVTLGTRATSSILYVQPWRPDCHMHKISIEKFQEMLYAVSRFVARIPAVLVQYGRNAPVLQFSKAAYNRPYTMPRSCIHKQHMLKLGIKQSVHDVKRLRRKQSARWWLQELCKRVPRFHLRQTAPVAAEYHLQQATSLVDCMTSW
jgi:hypothetical protein